MQTMTLAALCRRAPLPALDEFVRRCLASAARASAIVPGAGEGHRRAAAIATSVRRQRLNP